MPYQGVAAKAHVVINGIRDDFVRRNPVKLAFFGLEDRRFHGVFCCKRVELAEQGV